MGVIQNAINQMLGTVGVATRLLPGYETRQELHKLGKQEDILKAKRDAAVESIKARKEEGNLQLKDMEQDVNVLEETAEDVEKLRKRQFELNPSVESYEKYTKSKNTVKTVEALKQEREMLLTKRQEQANLKAAEKSESKQLQKRNRRNFMDFLKNVEIQGGGTVGDLPTHLQKEIAKQYSKSERKQLMDKEKKDGK